jgi:hypothetical protein
MEKKYYARHMVATIPGKITASELVLVKVVVKRPYATVENLKQTRFEAVRL